MSAPLRPTSQDAGSRTAPLGRAAFVIAAIMLGLVPLRQFLGGELSGVAVVGTYTLGNVLGLTTIAGCITAIVLATLALRREKRPLLPAIALGAAGALLANDVFFAIWTML